VHRYLVIALVLAFALVAPMAGQAALAAQDVPEGAVLTPDDIGPSFEVVGDSTSTFGSGANTAVVYFVLYGRDPATSGASGPYVIESAYIGGPAAARGGIDELMNGLLMGLNLGQVFETELVSGPPVGDDARWVGGWGVAEDANQEIHGVLTQVGESFVGVIVLGFEGEVSQSDAADYASVLVDRLR
jgi:hypothetical protein